MTSKLTASSATSSLPLSTNSTPSTPPPEPTFHAEMDGVSLKSDRVNSSATNLVRRERPFRAEARRQSSQADDARSMSPRRSSAETEKLGRDTRRAMQERAKSLQSGLAALAEKIETVRMDHDKLEKQNSMLQDYIGGLTRSMSRTDISSSKGKK